MRLWQLAALLLLGIGATLAGLGLLAPPPAARRCIEDGSVPVCPDSARL